MTDWIRRVSKVGCGGAPRVDFANEACVGARGGRRGLEEGRGRNERSPRCLWASGVPDQWRKLHLGCQAPQKWRRQQQRLARLQSGWAVPGAFPTRDWTPRGLRWYLRLFPTGVRNVPSIPRLPVVGQAPERDARTQQSQSSGHGPAAPKRQTAALGWAVALTTTRNRTKRFRWLARGFDGKLQVPAYNARFSRCNIAPWHFTK